MPQRISMNGADRRHPQNQRRYLSQKRETELPAQAAALLEMLGSWRQSLPDPRQGCRPVIVKDLGRGRLAN
jgi:hypothetical protein